MSRDSEFTHQPVLLPAVIAALKIRPDGCYVDCTLGGGGHAAAILEQLGPQGHLIGIDRDADALKAAAARLAGTASPAKHQVLQGNFADLAEILAGLGIAAVDGILADLGVSSWQLDASERGFSYSQAGNLDMRMNQSDKLTAAEIVNTWSETEIAAILSAFGEERYAGRISRAIVSRRAGRVLQTTTELAELVCQAMPAAARREAQHPARRTFQALRLAVNQELAALDALLLSSPSLLADNGRLCIITFHSLEDRRVKQTFARLESPCTCPRTFPVCVCGKQPLGRRVGRQASIANTAETDGNPRARSAKLRCFERQFVPGRSDNGGH
jgi:16S rRNA (cytosine1402-N4)-methyltransferase